MMRSCLLWFPLLVAMQVCAFAPQEVALSKLTNGRGEWASTRLKAEKTKEKESQKRQPWNVLRFVQQSSKFVSLPFVPSSTKDTQSIVPGEVVWQPGPTKSRQLFQWAPLDDVVMGGVSFSNVDNASGLWKGSVTDANNGGFVGIRSTPNVQLDLTACRGLELTFQTTPTMPRRLKVVLRDSTDFNGIAWTASVNVPASTGKQQVTVKVPLTKQSFVPTIFARIVEEAKEKGINTSSITAMQLVYSKFELEGALNPQFAVGDFELQLLQVKAY